MDPVKTTIEIPDKLMRDVKQYAVTQGVPIREVFERGVRQLVEGKSRGKFKMRVITVKGKGLATEPSWENIRSLIYQGQGS